MQISQFAVGVTELFWRLKVVEMWFRTDGVKEMYKKGRRMYQNKPEICVTSWILTSIWSVLFGWLCAYAYLKQKSTTVEARAISTFIPLRIFGLYLCCEFGTDASLHLLKSIFAADFLTKNKWTFAKMQKRTPLARWNPVNHL